MPFCYPQPFRVGIPFQESNLCPGILYMLFPNCIQYSNEESLLIGDERSRRRVRPIGFKVVILSIMKKVRHKEINLPVSLADLRTPLTGSGLCSQWHRGREKDI